MGLRLRRHSALDGVGKAAFGIAEGHPAQVSSGRHVEYP